MPRKPVAQVTDAATTDLAVYRSAAGDLDSYRKDAEQSTAELAAFVIVTEDDRLFCLELCQDVKRRHNALEDKRKQVTQPLNAVIREINGWFKPVTTALEQAERTLKAKLLAYDQQVLDANRKALAEAAAAHTPQGAQSALERIAPAPAPLPGASAKTTWALTVESPAAVPREYCVPDAALLRVALQDSLATTGQPPEIPGVRFWQERTLAVRV